MTRLPCVLSPTDLPLPELLSARLDGELFAVGGCFSPVDEIEGSVHRALALTATSPKRVIAERGTAAWLWGALATAPVPHELCVPKGARRHVSGDWHRVREVVIRPHELTTVAGMPVTTPLRTALDLARWSRWCDSRVLRSLALTGGFTLAECVAELGRTRNLPGRRRALARVRAAIRETQPEFTR